MRTAFIVWPKEITQDFTKFYSKVVQKDKLRGRFNLKRTHLCHSYDRLRTIEREVLETSGYDIKIYFDKLPEDWCWDIKDAIIDQVNTYRDLLGVLSVKENDHYRVARSSLLHKSGVYKYTQGKWKRIKGL